MASAHIWPSRGGCLSMAQLAIHRDSFNAMDGDVGLKISSSGFLGLSLRLLPSVAFISLPFPLAHLSVVCPLCSFVSSANSTEGKALLSSFMIPSCRVPIDPSPTTHHALTECHRSAVHMVERSQHLPNLPFLLSIPLAHKSHWHHPWHHLAPLLHPIPRC
jgi:hypothetical protein